MAKLSEAKIRRSIRHHLKTGIVSPKAALLFDRAHTLTLDEKSVTFSFVDKANTILGESLDSIIRVTVPRGPTKQVLEQAAHQYYQKQDLFYFQGASKMAKPSRELSNLLFKNDNLTINWTDQFVGGSCLLSTTRGPKGPNIK